MLDLILYRTALVLGFLLGILIAAAGLPLPF